MIDAATYSAHSQQALGRARLALLIASGTTAAWLCLALLYLGRDVLAIALIVAFGAMLVLGRWPHLGFYTIFGAAMLLDGYYVAELDLPSGWVPFWKSYSGVSAADAILLCTFGFLLLHRMHRGGLPLRGGRLFTPCLAFAGAVTFALWRGITHSDLQSGAPFHAGAALAEMKALVYLPLMYVLAHNVVESRRQVRMVMGIAIVAVGLKALQGAWTVARFGWGVFDLNEIAIHDDSLLWISLVLLTAVLWVCRGPRPERWAVAALLPFTVISLVANQRRTSFVALALGLVLCGAILLADRRLRGRVLRAGTVVVLLVGMYGAAFWNVGETNPVAFPVYSIRSVYDPTERLDLESNLWREMERANIERTIHRSPLLGIGFGRQYVTWIKQQSLDATPFKYWRYITHNEIYWVWMKLGAVGFATFWYLAGSTVVLGCLVFRRHDAGDLQAAALMSVGLVIMQILFAYGDQGITGVRNMACLGTWMGVLASLHRLQPMVVRPDLPDGERSWRR